MHETTRPEELAAFATDFGRILTRTPRAVLRPSTTADVVDAVRAARRDGAPLATRGAAHSQSGQSLGDATVLDMTGLGDVVAIDAAARTVTVQSGVAWGDLLDALAPHALAPPVFTNNLNVTI